MLSLALRFVHVLCSQLNPQHIGCGHLRLMLTKPEVYGVRHNLILHVLRVSCAAVGSSRIVLICSLA